MMVGFGANRRGGRLPGFVLVALMVVLLVLSFNYWAVSSKQGQLLGDLAEAEAQAERSDVARGRLEKRNSELMAQVDAHRKQIDQKDSDYRAVESRLQTREGQVKKCTDEKGTLQSEVVAQVSEIQRLKEQLKELQQELLKQEAQVREVRKNSTHLEKKLEYESLQCGRQIAELKEEYEDRKKTLELEAVKLRQGVLENQGGAAVGGHIVEGQATGERHTEATHRHDSPELKDLGKPGSDAGMPGIEDSEVGKTDDLHFALKKPAITQNHLEEGLDGDDGKEERAGGGEGAGREPEPEQEEGDHGRPETKDPSRPPQAAADKPAALVEDSKAPIRADELGEQPKAPDAIKAEGQELNDAGSPPGPNPAQVLPNPIESSRARDPMPADLPRHRQSRFFDENESPVDPQRGSKLADYNGDDGNVGEYEADKQAELAYNEEEDGDGGEEDVQDDEDRDLHGERAADYGKRHQANNIL